MSGAWSLGRIFSDQKTLALFECESPSLNMLSTASVDSEEAKILKNLVQHFEVPIDASPVDGN
jgi:hypothetical protein